MRDVIIIFVLFAALLLMQAGGGYLQIKNYREVLARMRPLGNIGVGQKRGFMNGGIVVIACDSEGIIKGVQALEGQSIFARFKEKKKLKSHELSGANVRELLKLLQNESPGSQKDNIAYINALTGLVNKLDEVKG